MKFLYPASRSRCSIYLYTSFLLSCPYRAECTKLSSIQADLSHDSVNRFLLNSDFKPRDLFDESKYLLKLNMTGGVISVDDTILDKPHCRLEHNDLVQRHYSGKHKKAVKGICLITLFYTDKHGRKAPINYRIFTKDNEAKVSKNEIFREMLREVLLWKVKPRYITSDCWYATQENLFWFRSLGIGICVGVSKRALVYKPPRKTMRDPYQRYLVGELNISKRGRQLVLPGAGIVTIFQSKMRYSDEVKYFALKQPESYTELRKRKVKYTRPEITEISRSHTIKRYMWRTLRSIHWQIELYHRTLKNFCSLETFMVRKARAVRTHIHCSLRGYIILQYNKLRNIIQTDGELRMRLYNRICRLFLKALHELDVDGVSFQKSPRPVLFSEYEFW
jgi:hypothetical protein